MGRYLRLLAGSILAALFFLHISPVTLRAESAAGNFVDVDGDGFDDNLLDSDANSIPDLFEPAVETKVMSLLSSATDMSSGIFSNQPSDVSILVSYKSRVEHFNGRLSGCFGLDKCRGDFESDFGAGIGFTLGSGGGCVGGVCF